MVLLCYHGIGLVEMVWKALIVLLNLCFAASITYHDSLHGFRSFCGMGAASFDFKLIQQVTSMREEILYMILLDLHKAYDALERSRLLEILEGYVVGPRDLYLL